MICRWILAVYTIIYTYAYIQTIIQHVWQTPHPRSHRRSSGDGAPQTPGGWQYPSSHGTVDSMYIYCTYTVTHG